MSTFVLESIGADPEFFIGNADTGVAVRGVGVIPGTKYEPKRLTNCLIQLDNVAAELNITPAISARDFSINCKQALEDLRNLLTEHNMSILTSPVTTFDSVELMSQEAQQFGCDPDFDVRKLAENRPVRPERLGNTRVAGGHVHVGYSSDLSPVDVARLMDLFVTIPLIAHGIDTCGASRRRFYGKAGSIRTKEYGIEYRTPDSGWMHHQYGPDFIWETLSALEAIDVGLYLRDEVLDKRVVSAINTGNVRVAKELTDNYISRDIVSLIAEEEYDQDAFVVPDDMSFAESVPE